VGLLNLEPGPRAAGYVLGLKILRHQALIAAREYLRPRREARIGQPPGVGERARAIYRKKINRRKGSMPPPFAIICPGGQS
jgi:hypothetical protein